MKRSVRSAIATAASLSFLSVSVIALAACGSGGSKTTATSGTDATSPSASIQGADEVASTLRGIKQWTDDEGNAVLGQRGAKVTITEYADLQCPFCSQFSKEVFPEVVSKYVRPGKVLYRYVNTPVVGPDSEEAAEGALAAAEQNRMYNYVELFYANQKTENSGYVTSEFMSSVAAGAGLDVSQWKSQTSNPAFPGALQKNVQALQKDRFQGTPAFVIEGPSGSEKIGGVPKGGFSGIASAIEKVGG